ncbi:hypothetical protein H8K29_02080 [Undibacterium sp. CY21W]|nr:hypothetical protein [Undibacterium sp. CY21W]
MSDNLAFSLMARMHVILRRQNERVIDIEYMRIDPVYCRYILDLALELPNTDLHDICLKLEEIYFGEHGLFVATEPAPLIKKLEGLKIRPKTPLAAIPAVSANLVAATVASAGATELPTLDQNSIVDQTYIGRLR